MKKIIQILLLSIGLIGFSSSIASSSSSSANDIDILEPAQIAEMVVASDNNTNFVGPIISNSKTNEGLDDDLQEYHLSSIKDKSYGFLKHKLNLSITYTSDSKRNYLSANYCNNLQSCDDQPEEIINVISASELGCNGTSCKYKEIMELDVPDYVLRYITDEGLSVSFNSKKFANIINISFSYITGYLEVAK